MKYKYEIYVCMKYKYEIYVYDSHMYKFLVYAYETNYVYKYVLKLIVLYEFFET